MLEFWLLYHGTEAKITYQVTKPSSLEQQPHQSASGTTQFCCPPRFFYTHHIHIVWHFSNSSELFSDLKESNKMALSTSANLCRHHPVPLSPACSGSGWVTVATLISFKLHFAGTVRSHFWITVSYRLRCHSLWRMSSRSETQCPVRSIIEKLWIFFNLRWYAEEKLYIDNDSKTICL